MSLLQTRFDSEWTKYGQTYAVIVNEIESLKNIGELLYLLSLNHKEHIISAVIDSLKGETEF